MRRFWVCFTGGALEHHLERNPLTLLLGVTVHNHPDRQIRNASWNIHAILSFGLGVFTNVLFCVGMLAIYADEDFRLAAIAFPFLAVPICFVWSLFAFVTGKDQRGRRLSLLTLLVSGPFVIVGIVFLGIGMIFSG